MPSLPSAHRPEELGFSSTRLKRLTDAVRRDVEAGALPGAVMLIARNGRLAYHEAIGFRDRDAKAPMATDTLFRIASLTKPVTSVALMTLVEEGLVHIEDAVGVYLPELQNLAVGVERLDPRSGTRELTLEPAQREPTVQDLLRHTSGFTYGQFGNSLVKQAYRDVAILDEAQSPADFVTKLSKLPLSAQPGSTWDYGVSVDVLGRIVEVVSGRPIDAFIAERITGPLGLTSTGFVVAPDNLPRLAQPQADPQTGARPNMRDVTRRHSFLNAGGGLVSTAGDYARFAQMLLNGGELDGERVLAPRTIAYMASNHLPPGVKYDAYYASNPDWTIIAPTPERGQGFGLGFAVRTERGRNPLPGSPGEFYWVGATGTAFWIDPQENLIAVWMSQIPWSQSGHYRSLLRTMVYQALLG
ncbi:MAG: beta-lactamase family protein [Variibacter sp.]|nr:beta-lactamase family protein [Variibacter sp.]